MFGLGTVGLICVQLAKLSGARVIACDPLAPRRALATSLGADLAVEARRTRRSAIKEASGGGADVCLEASGSPAALHEAIRSCRVPGDGRGARLLPGRGARRSSSARSSTTTGSASLSSQIGAIQPELSARWNRAAARADRDGASARRAAAPARADHPPGAVPAGGRDLPAARRGPVEGAPGGPVLPRYARRGGLRPHGRGGFA